MTFTVAQIDQIKANLKIIKSDYRKKFRLRMDIEGEIVQEYNTVIGNVACRITCRHDQRYSIFEYAIDDSDIVLCRFYFQGKVLKVDHEMFNSLRVTLLADDQAESWSTLADMISAIFITNEDCIIANPSSLSELLRNGMNPSPREFMVQELEKMPILFEPQVLLELIDKGFNEYATFSHPPYYISNYVITTSIHDLYMEISYTETDGLHEDLYISISNRRENFIKDLLDIIIFSADGDISIRNINEVLVPDGLKEKLTKFRLLGNLMN